MKKNLFILLVLLFAGAAQAAPIVNGGFESGLTGWTGTGNVSAVSSYVATNGASNVYTTVTPTEGGMFGLIKAGNPTSSLTSSLVSVMFGQTINFDWFFSAEDYMDFNDFGGFAIDLVSSGTTVAANVLASVSSVGDWGLTGWNTASIVSPVSGDLALKFYAVNVGDNLFDSALGIDNVGTVPAPATLALFGLGLVAVGYQQRKKADELQIDSSLAA